MQCVEFQIQTFEQQRDQLVEVWQKCDLNTNQSFPINLKYKDLTDPTSTEFNFSNQISLPKTQTNNKIFEQIWRLDRFRQLSDSFNPIERTKFRLFVNQDIFQSGYLKLEQKYLNPNKDYKLRLFGGLGDYFYNLSEIPLSSIRDGLTDQHYDHSISANTLYDLWTTTPPTGQIYYYDHSISNYRTEGAWTYCPTYQGHYEAFDSKQTYRPTIVEGQTVNFNPVNQLVIEGQVQQQLFQYADAEPTEHQRQFISGTQRLVNNQFVDTENFYCCGEYRSYYQKPALKVRPIYNRILDILQEKGWTTELDRSFFNDTNPYWNDLWMICPNYTIEGGEGSDDNILTEVDILNNNKSTEAPDAQETIGISPEYRGRNINEDWIFYNQPTTKLSGKVSTVSIAIPINLAFKRYRGSLREINLEGLSVRVNLNINNTSYNIEEIKRGERELVLNNENVNSLIPSSGEEYRVWPGLKGYNNSVYESKDIPSGTEFVFSDKVDIDLSNLPEGQAVNFTLTLHISGSSAWYTGNTFEDWAVRFYIREGSNIGDIENTRSNSLITFNKILRSEKSCKDFIVDYGKLFDLLYIKDEASQKVSIVTRNTFYGQQDRVDWTDKIDISKDIVSDVVPFEDRFGVFKYKSLDTKYEDIYLAEFGSAYGQVKFDTNYKFSDSERDYIDSDTFCNSVISSESHQYYRSRTPIIYKDNKELLFLQDKDGGGIEQDGFILAFLDGLYTTTSDTSTIPTFTSSRQYPGWFVVTDDNPQMQIDGYTYRDDILPDQRSVSQDNTGAPLKTLPNFVRTIEREGAIYSLNFGVPRKSYNSTDTIGGTTTDGSQSIYSRFWSNYLRDRFDENNEYLTCNVNLNYRDIQEDLFRKFIYINDTIWVLDSISGYNPLSHNSTKVKLVKVYDVSNYIGQSYYNIRWSELNITTGYQQHSLTNNLIVPSQYNWTITADPDLLVITPSSGQGNSTVEFIIPEYTDFDQNRVFTITANIFDSTGTQVDTKTFTITQTPAVRYLNISPVSITGIDYRGGTYTVDINTNLSWQITFDGITPPTIPIITVSPLSGVGTTTVTVTVPANNSTEIRTGNFRVSAIDNSLTAVHNWSQNHSVEPARISLTQIPNTIPPSGGAYRSQVSSNRGWILSASDTWISVQPTTGQNDQNITVYIEDNTNITSRSGSVRATIPGETAQSSIYFTQEAATE